MSPDPPPDAAADRRVRRSKRTVRVLQILLAFSVGFAGWSIGFRPDDGQPPVLPDTENQFSLDLDVVDAYDHPTVYVVEQRARPAYRIFAFDPTTGTDQTVFTVPEDAIIYGIALSRDRTTLAVTYSPDFHVEGSGLWTLDLTTKTTTGDSTLTPIVSVTEDVYLTAPTWSSDDSAAYATRVDRTSDDEQLDVISIDTESGTANIVADNAVDPLVTGEDLYFFEVDDNGARRSLESIDQNGQRTTIEVGDRTLDLDHLLHGADRQSLVVSAIENEEELSRITFGQPAEAHGNHDVPSNWWIVPLDGNPAIALDSESNVTYDAALHHNTIVSATREGLSFTTLTSAGLDAAEHEVIESRALRFVAS